MELTRTIQIEVTKVYRNVPNLPKDALLLREVCEKRIREQIEEELNGTDQLIVEVKDFIRENEDE